MRRDSRSSLPAATLLLAGPAQCSLASMMLEWGGDSVVAQPCDTEQFEHDRVTARSTAVPQSADRVILPMRYTALDISERALGRDQLMCARKCVYALELGWCHLSHRTLSSFDDHSRCDSTAPHCSINMNCSRSTFLLRKCLLPRFPLDLCIRRGLARMLADPENKGSQQRHVNFDTLGTWDNRIDFGLMLQQSIKHGKPIPKIQLEDIGSANVMGRRNYNEDFYRTIELKPNMLYFAVFDGHGGDACARFCNEHMPKFINDWLERGEHNMEIVLQNAFLDVNNAFARYLTYTRSGDEELANSGTTAIVCLLKNSTELVVAHVGDSRAFLCRDGASSRLTNDHTALSKTEKARIVNSNGFIVNGYVNGRLAMTRSIGDLDLKPYGVIAHPETRTIEIKHGRDAFVLLTTDGISDVLNDREVVNAVQSCDKPMEAAKFVTDQALHYSCEDNATALIVPFGAWGKFKNHRETYNQFFSFGRQLQNSVRF